MGISIALAPAWPVGSSEISDGAGLIEEAGASWIPTATGTESPIKTDWETGFAIFSICKIGL